MIRRVIGAVLVRAARHVEGKAAALDATICGRVVEPGTHEAAIVQVGARLVAVHHDVATALRLAAIAVMLRAR